MPDDALDLGIDQIERVLDNQVASVDSIQTKVGVLIGFAATSLALLFSFGYGWVTGHVAIASVSAAALLASVAIFAASYMLAAYEQAPDPAWLVGLMNKRPLKLDEIKAEVIGSAWKAYDANKVLIDRRFSLVNWAIGLLIVGLGIFVIGVLAT